MSGHVLLPKLRAHVAAAVRPERWRGLWDSADIESRRRFFAQRQGNRYWWHRRTGDRYLPDCYGVLSAADWQVLRSWYSETDDLGQVGECAVPLIGWLTSFVSSNNVERVVQLGTYAGYSALLLGFALRRMRKSCGLVAIDIDARMCEVTRRWIHRAKLDAQVQVICGDSAAAERLDECRAYLGGAPQLVFIDSSHQYAHTLRELDLWYGAVAPGGLIALHDTSEQGSTYDTTQAGGVQRALVEWTGQRAAKSLNLAVSSDQAARGELVYLDGCGLGLVFKEPALA